MFLHQGQDNIKELRFHPYYANMIVTTAEDSYNIFKPNLDPEEEDDEEEASTADKNIKGSNYYVDSEEEEVEEEKRMIRAAKKLSKK